MSGVVVRRCDRETGKERGHFKGHTPPRSPETGRGIISVAFAKDGQRALSLGNDGTIRILQLPQ
jgi:hypothetical protein